MVRRVVWAGKYRVLLFIGVGLGLLLTVFIVRQFMVVAQAHSSFENYYQFRGCQQLLTKDNSDATCRLGSGKVIKIVKYQDKWYLDGDLPNCWWGRSLCW